MKTIAILILTLFTLPVFAQYKSDSAAVEHLYIAGRLGSTGVLITAISPAWLLLSNSQNTQTIGAIIIVQSLIGYYLQRRAWRNVRKTAENLGAKLY